MCCIIVPIDLQLPPGCEVEFTVPEHCSTAMHSLLTSTANYQAGDSVRLLAMFSSAVLKQQSDTVKLKLSGLIVTGSALVILEDNAQWLLPDSDRVPLVAREQAMSNLIAIVSNFRSFLSLFTNLQFAAQDRDLLLRTKVHSAQGWISIGYTNCCNQLFGCTVSVNALMMHLQEHRDISLTLNFLDEVAGREESWSLEFASPGAVEAVISSIQPPWEELFSIPLQVTTRTARDNAEKV